MNVFLNHALISLNTASRSKNIFLMMIEKLILIIGNILINPQCSSITSAIFFWGRGSRLTPTMLTQEGGGVQSKGKLTYVMLEHSLQFGMHRKRFSCLYSCISKMCSS